MDTDVNEMNKIYRLVWCQAKRAWVVCSELGSRQGKGRSKLVVTAALAVSAIPVSAFATCTADGGGTNANASGTATAAYIQNTTIDCTSDTVTTTIGGSYAGYGSLFELNPKIAAETSQVLRWTNASSSTAMQINVDNGVTVSGSGLTRPLLYSRTGYYTTNGNGTSVVASWITPDARASMSITNNGTVNYTGTSSAGAYDFGSAIGMDADDSPVDQLIVNNGTVNSSSAWGISFRDAASNWLGSFRALSGYLYSYNNIVGLTNSGTITQTGSLSSSSNVLKAHASAVELLVPSAAQAYVVNNANASISGSNIGVDILTTNRVTNAYIPTQESLPHQGPALTLTL